MSPLWVRGAGLPIEQKLIAPNVRAGRGDNSLRKPLTHDEKPEHGEAICLDGCTQMA
jgi:hypothetical protein